MLKWLLGSLFAKQEDAVKSGIQYDVDFFRLLGTSIRKMDLPTLEKLAVVAEEYIAEMTDEATGLVNGAVVDDLLSGKSHDPFAQSRHDLEALLGK